jgi:hypothetical protein
MAVEHGVLAMALVSSAAAALAPFVQREEERFPLSLERRILFVFLLLDAATLWIVLARLHQSVAGPELVVTLFTLMLANMTAGGWLLWSGHALPPPLRWTGVLLMSIVEPVFFFLSILAILGTA